MVHELTQNQQAKECQDYLAKHHIQTLFEKLMAELLENRPTSPYQYLTERLREIQQDGLQSTANKAEVVFILGGPGTGKGTQCAKLVDEYGFVHVSTGDLLRKEVEQESERGEMIKEKMDKGEIVPGKVTIELLKDFMDSKPSGTTFLVDGFPREIEQAMDFENDIVESKFVLFFQCDQEVMEERLLKRGETSGRSDDNRETIRQRLQVFEDQTLPVIKYYDKYDKVKRVDASKDIEEVYKETKSLFE